MTIECKTKPTGQSLIEYAIILAIVALAIFSLLAAYGDEIGELYRSVTEMW